MFIECVTLTNFRCFAAETRVELEAGTTAFVGANGAGKTAVLQGLLRMFGVTGEQRRVTRQDFHVPATETTAPTERALAIDALLTFPELDGNTAAPGIPQFFHHLAADDAGRLKCRLRLDATWTDDGSLDGVVVQSLRAIRSFGDFADDDCIDVRPVDRARVQMVYVPASRDGSSQLTSFLKGRLWRAVNWSDDLRAVLGTAGSSLNDAFNSETAVALVQELVGRRWSEVHTAGTETAPVFRPVDLRFQEFVRKVDVAFIPGPTGRPCGIHELSDGQRSLFHLAITAATLDVEGRIINDPASSGFNDEEIVLPALTLIAIEEPENSLAPFYLSRIIRQLVDLTGGGRAQAIVSSHSASILARVPPDRVRHFRLDLADRTALVRRIRLPEGEEEAEKYVREAVRAYPELYFARLVVLGEGASEEIVLPRLATALGLDVDPSFVAVVPLGGRHVNHFWRLLDELAIPHLTLLDLDLGRDGGAWGRIKSTCAQLLQLGIPAPEVFGNGSVDDVDAKLALFDNTDPANGELLDSWLTWLRRFGVFFCAPLDLDYMMLTAFPGAYQVIEEGRRGPSATGDPRTAVLGESGRPDLYDGTHDQRLRWYRYLFLGRGKPSTHVRVLGSLDDEALAAQTPEVLRGLLSRVIEILYGGDQTATDEG